MHLIACTHASTHATSAMFVKKACTTSIYDTYCLGHWNEENQQKKHQNEETSENQNQMKKHQKHQIK